MRAEQDKETSGVHLAMMTSMSGFKLAVSFLFNWGYGYSYKKSPWGNCFKHIVNNSTFQALQARCCEWRESKNNVHILLNQVISSQTWVVMTRSRLRHSADWIHRFPWIKWLPDVQLWLHNGVNRGQEQHVGDQGAVEKMTGEYDLKNKHEVKRKVQLQFLRQVIVQLETFLSR